MPPPTKAMSDNTPPRSQLPGRPKSAHARMPAENDTDETPISITITRLSSRDVSQRNVGPGPTLGAGQNAATAIPTTQELETSQRVRGGGIDRWCLTAVFGVPKDPGAIVAGAERTSGDLDPPTSRTRPGTLDAPSSRRQSARLRRELTPQPAQLRVSHLPVRSIGRV